jgi:hypothetical protein
MVGSTLNPVFDTGKGRGDGCAYLYYAVLRDAHFPLTRMIFKRMDSVLAFVVEKI